MPGLAGRMPTGRASAAQQAASVRGPRGHRHSGHGPTRPPSAYATRRGDAAGARCPSSELRHVVVFLKDAPARNADADSRARSGRGTRPSSRASSPCRSGSEVRLPERRSDLPQRLLAVARARRSTSGAFRAASRARCAFDKPGIVKVFCDIHSHMTATVMVFNHPWFAMPDDGRPLRAVERAAGPASRSRRGTNVSATPPCRCASSPAGPLGGRFRASGPRAVRRPPRLVTRTVGGDLHHGRRHPVGRLHRARSWTRAIACAPPRPTSCEVARACFTRVRGAAAAGPARGDRRRWPRTPRSRPRSTPTSPRPDWARETIVGSRPLHETVTRELEKLAALTVGQRAGDRSTPTAACSRAPAAPRQQLGRRTRR